MDTYVIKNFTEIINVWLWNNTQQAQILETKSKVQKDMLFHLNTIKNMQNTLIRGYIYM